MKAYILVGFWVWAKVQTTVYFIKTSYNYLPRPSQLPCRLLQLTCVQYSGAPKPLCNPQEQVAHVKPLFSFNH